MKLSDTDSSRWYRFFHHAVWSDRVTVRRRLGCSPYFALTGTEPLLPLDVTEVTYLLPPPEFPLSNTDLMARRALALMKREEDLARLHSTVYAARLAAARQFEAEHSRVIRDYNFKPGSLVIVRNTRWDTGLRNKTRVRYFGPLVVLSRNRGGAYILCDLDGTVYHRPFAAFRVLPYFARSHVDLPPLESLIDISTARLREMEASADPAEDDDDAEHHVDDLEEADELLVSFLLDRGRSQFMKGGVWQSR
ncbi:hypothetical protein PENSPDRAFT_595291 [Peniophora sp. CONT]|nr:hypothetical protein PENSPDRAFT_595291 [Peniophora sp. CONT]